MQNELKQLLRDKAEEMQLQHGAPARVLRRARRRRLVNGALAGAFALGLVATGYVGIRAALIERTDITTPSSPSTITPSESPTTEPSPSPTLQPTLGFAFPVCDVTSVEGHFRDEMTLGTAYVATKRGDVGDCPQPGTAFTVIGVDLTGDGEVDTSYGPIECYPINCLAYAAPDIDGNGASELAVVQQHGSVLGLRLYAFEAGAENGVEILPLEVAPPGDPEGGFGPGEQPSLWARGGDGFNSYGLRCEDGTDGRVLVAVSAVQDPPDRTDSVWQAHETTFALRTGGTLEVVGTRDFQEPVTFEWPSFASEDRLCGLSPGS